MDGAVPKVWKIGQACTVRTLMATIVDIVPSVLGISMYKVCFVDSRETDTVPKHLLQEIEGFDDDDDDFFATINTEDINASDKSQCSTPAKYNRFLKVSEEDIDTVAKSRLSQHTEYQTRWAVNLFKGKNYVILNKKIII